MLFARKGVGSHAVPGIDQAVLLTSVFEQRVSF